jgi:hypothetical protein
LVFRISDNQMKTCHCITEGKAVLTILMALLILVMFDVHRKLCYKTHGVVFREDILKGYVATAQMT